MAAQPSVLDAAEHRPWSGGPSFSLRNRLYRIAWILVWTFCARWTPPSFRGWRRLLLRTFGASIAPTATVYSSARIWAPANLVMHTHATIGPAVTVYSMGRITIGEFAVVSQRAHLCAASHDISDPHFQLQLRPIDIGPRAWIAAEAFVGPGVTIGEGAVLGARACAMRDLLPWSVHIGNPAAKVGERRMRRQPLGQPASPAEVSKDRTEDRSVA